MAKVYHRHSLDDTATTRVCADCLIEKSFSQFYKSSRGGYQGNCKICFDAPRKQQRAEARLVRNQARQALVREQVQAHVDARQAQKEARLRQIEEERKAKDTDKSGVYRAVLQAPLFPVYSIYALIDPTDQAVRYIGMSERPDLRLVEHIKISYGRKRRWIQGLQKQGLAPLLDVIETTDNKQHAFDRETYWIHRYAKQYPLLNGSLHLKKRNPKRPS